MLNTIINAEIYAGLEPIPDDSIDLIVTSPPYNCGIAYDTWDDKMAWGDYLDWVYRWMYELRRVLKPDGRIAINVPIDMGIEDNTGRVSPFREYLNIMAEIGFLYKGCASWIDSHRAKFTAWGSWKSASAPYIYNPYEMIIIAYKEKWKKDKKGIDTISDKDFKMGTSGIWNIFPETNGLTKANFPVALPKLCIELLSFKGEIVLDPFMGSGTTAIAAIRTERNFIGIEISEKYCQVANDRIAKERYLFNPYIEKEKA